MWGSPKLRGVVLNEDSGTFICPNCTSISGLWDLPSFNFAPLADFDWHGSPSIAVHKLIDELYFQVVHWRPNLFTVPYGYVGRSFVSELTFLLQSFSTHSAIEPFALKAAMLMPNLLLQRSQCESKLGSKAICSCFQ